MTFVDETRFDLAVWLSRVAVYKIMPEHYSQQHTTPMKSDV